jgi:hypothetical protein
MVVESLVAVPLRGRTVEVGAPGWAESLASLLLDGRWRPAILAPDTSAGLAVARLHRWARGVDPGARATAGPGAVDVFDSAATAPPGEDLESVPAAWSDGQLGGAMTIAPRAGDLAAAAHARMAERTRGPAPALRLVLRGVRADLLPAEGEDPTYQRELGAALRRPGAFDDLRELLLRDARLLADGVAAAFADRCDAPVEIRHRVRLLPRGVVTEDLLRGLPPGTARHAATVAEWFEALRPPVEVLRHRWDGSVELWRGEVLP